ncbi:MAG TPA: aminotransferase class III-fold pyridoxal phosphate-dependent enzyme, partial [Acidimicrobiales bacterium]|nr:aminotransferase class III-fold pyridoxal phosphate-dependent enzyme [Acidimicrobiales bacterium]
AAAEALAQADAAFAAHPHDIACFVAEPIQAEGGDRHLSAAFLRAMQERCRRHDALFVLDEVQTGVGGAGGRWAYEVLGLEPDVVAFAKKAQVGGIMAGRRVDLVPDNVFAVSGRINSTWGGGLVDMVRSRRILEVIERDGLFAAAAERGAQLAAGLRALQDERPALVANARGRGLMCAIDLPGREVRDAVLADLRTTEGILALACGPASIRFRPALTISAGQVDQVLAGLARSVARVGAAALV